MEKRITVRFTYEELRLLSDQLSMSYIHNEADADTVKLSEIGDRLNDALLRGRKAAP